MDDQRFPAVASAGSLRSAAGRSFPHRWTPEGVVVEADFTGAHLLHLAAAGCVLNDVYREARGLGIRIRGVRVSSSPGQRQRPSEDDPPGRHEHNHEHSSTTWRIQGTQLRAKIVSQAISISRRSRRGWTEDTVHDRSASPNGHSSSRPPSVACDGLNDVVWAQVIVDNGVYANRQGDGVSVVVTTTSAAVSDDSVTDSVVVSEVSTGVSSTGSVVVVVVFVGAVVFVEVFVDVLVFGLDVLGTTELGGAVGVVGATVTVTVVTAAVVAAAAVAAAALTASTGWGAVAFGIVVGAGATGAGKVSCVMDVAKAFAQPS